MAENPYQAPRPVKPAKNRTLGFAREGNAWAGFVGLALLSIPAGLIALFATCFATYHVNKPSAGINELIYGYHAGLVLGGFLGSCATAFVLVGAVRYLRREMRRTVFALLLIIGVSSIVAVCILFGTQPQLWPRSLG